MNSRHRESSFINGKPLRLASVSLFLFWSALPVLAHDTWVMPRAAAVPSGSPLALDLTSGMSFPALEYAIPRDRIARASFRLNGKTTEIRDMRPEKNSLRLLAGLPQGGIATIFVETKRKDIELKPDEVKEYLEEIGAADTVGREWEKSGSKSWREIYTKHAKTFRLDRVGWWLLRGTDLRRSGSPSAEWESHFTTLTLEVRPEARP
ncbi:MAG: hypothetical protein ACRD1P_01600 [Thermoanaerobaculia bacterium]